MNPQAQPPLTPPLAPVGVPSVAVPVERPSVVPIVNVANALTVGRLLLVPVFFSVLVAGGGSSVGGRLLAAAIFGVACVTDHLDGELARRLGLVTDFGKIADPIADKALTGAAFVGLSLLHELAWWITIVVAVRELGVTLLRFWVIRLGVIPASRGGKLKTLVQTVAIALYVLPLPPSAGPVQAALMGFAVLLTVVTGLDYVLRALRLRTRSRRAGFSR